MGISSINVWIYLFGFLVAVIFLTKKDRATQIPLWKKYYKLLLYRGAYPIKVAIFIEKANNYTMKRDYGKFYKSKKGANFVKLLFSNVVIPVSSTGVFYDFRKKPDIGETVMAFDGSDIEILKEDSNAIPREINLSHLCDIDNGEWLFLIYTGDTYAPIRLPRLKEVEKQVEVISEDWKEWFIQGVKEDYHRLITKGEFWQKYGGFITTSLLFVCVLITVYGLMKISGDLATTTQTVAGLKESVSDFTASVKGAMQSVSQTAHQTAQATANATAKAPPPH
ncbi:hypothetical protein J7J18_04465 [bacterium]|nr:hypothetical protein [bacterium]